METVTDVVGDWTHRIHKTVELLNRDAEASDVLALNNPFAGTRYRETNACALAGGGALNCNGVVQVPFGGLTLSVSSVTSRHFISVSVQKP